MIANVCDDDQVPHAAESPAVISAVDARRVLLHLQRLGSSPTGSNAKSVQSMVDRLGYVQVDSINVLERAHHMILGTRLDGYRPEHLAHSLEGTRTLWEHWTHDACIIPTKWYPHWKHRFVRYGVRVQRSSWWAAHFGDDPLKTIRRTLARVKRDGPLKARDFEPPKNHRSAGWWEWHPEKAALEYLWRSGKLAIARRDRFEKVYDLAERVFPDAHGLAQSSQATHIQWACSEAIARIGIATPTEIARFFSAVTLVQARAWCVQAVARGELIEAVVPDIRQGMKPTKCVALKNWKTLCIAPNSDRIDLLSPFDPAIRERARVERLFGFDYRFEAFTPAAKRVYGYYVLPMLEGDALIGRVDPKFDRAKGTLIVRGPWWEPGVKSSKVRTQKLEFAIDRLAARIGAANWTMSL